ncbi:MAG: hypothetical protein WBH50_23865 [Fuerstiella sp.]
MPFRTSGKYDSVICDIDGCLSPESHAPINGPALSVIAHHNRQAIKDRDRPVVPLCSGRSIGFVECLCRLIHNTLIPCIGENGVWIWRPASNSFECNPAITDEHLEVVHEARKLLRSLHEAQGVIQQPGKSASVALYHPDTEYLRSTVSTIADEFRGLAVWRTLKPKLKSRRSMCRHFQKLKGCWIFCSGCLYDDFGFGSISP